MVFCIFVVPFSHADAILFFILCVFQFESGKCLYMVSWPSPLFKKVFGVVAFSLAFFIPLIILVYCYGRIVWILTRRLDFNINSVSSQSDTFELARTNTIKTMFTVALFFIICLSNNQIYYLMFTLGFKEDWNSPYYKFTMVMVFLNCTINPFIYLFKYQDFHTALKESLGCIKFKNVEESEIRCSTVSTSVLSQHPSHI